MGTRTIDYSELDIPKIKSMDSKGNTNCSFYIPFSNPGCSQVSRGFGIKLRIQNKDGSRFLNGIEVKHQPSAEELVNGN